MTPSYTLKVERAKQHIIDANNLIKKRRPFRYTVETDYEAGESSIGAKRNEAAIADLAIILGDAVHNLRTALDHRVWELVAPHCEIRDLKHVQFPFANSSERLQERFKGRKIDRGPKDVWTALEKLKPYLGGNDDLVLVHELDVLDKHKLLIPAADYTQTSGVQIRKLLPDFPAGLDGMAFSGNGRDVGWVIPKLARHQRKAHGFTEAGSKNSPCPWR